MGDRRKIKGVAYQVVQECLTEAGSAGAAVSDIAEDPRFDGYADPHSAIRRALMELIRDGWAGAIDPNETPVFYRSL